MANLNEVRLIGRLTRDPESFASGKGCKFGFAVNERKKVDGEWEEVPVFIDCVAWNSDKGRQLADTITEHLSKGSQVFLAGKLQLEQWTDKQDQKRSKLSVVVFDMQFLDSKKKDEDEDRPKKRSSKSGDDFDGQF